MMLMELLQQHYLGNYFSKLNQEYEIYIPDRKTEGYGPSIKSFQELIDKK